MLDCSSVADTFTGTWVEVEKALKLFEKIYIVRESKSNKFDPHEKCESAVLVGIFGNKKKLEPLKDPNT
ncbi:unnamed protein product [Trichobilharzia szidati]|nr:unnamed protein product [Trichobilharzia szidati]